MAGGFDGTAHLSLGEQLGLFLIGDPHCTVTLLKDQGTGQMSYGPSKWGPNNWERQRDLGTPGGAFPKTARYRYLGPEINIAGAIPEDEWVAIYAGNDGGGIGGTYTLRVLRLSTGLGGLLSGTAQVSGVDRTDQDEPVRVGDRNVASPIPFVGALGLALGLGREMTVDEFAFVAYHPLEAVRLLRGADLQFLILPGVTDSGTGLTVDLSGQNLHATKIGAGTIAKVDGPPVDMTGPMLGQLQPVEAGPPPTFNPAWADGTTFHEGRALC